MTRTAFPAAVKRWQVRWRDLAGGQRKRNFALKVGKNPDLHADAFEAKVSREVDSGDYIDAERAAMTLGQYAEDWRKSRSHDDWTAGNLERRLRLHVYQDSENLGVTPRGGIAIGQRRISQLARRPSLVQAWIAAIPLKESSARLVVSDIAAVFAAAIDDGICKRNPVRAGSVTRPGRGGVKAMPWTLERIRAMGNALPDRYQVVPEFGAGTGMRQGELFGLGDDDIAQVGRDRRVQVLRQVKLVGNCPHFAPVKNRKEHSVPLSASTAVTLDRHLKQYPALPVTLPWHDPKDPDRHGKLITIRLVLTDGRGHALHRSRFNEVWHAAQEKAGITPIRDRGERRLPAQQDGCHALRHTAASIWLRAGIDVVRVAAWLGDTPQVVLQTYAHLMPGDSGDDGRAAIDSFFSTPSAPYVPDVDAG